MTLCSPWTPKLKAWKAGMESKGLHVNTKKTKLMISSVDLDVQASVPVLSAARVSQCKLWVHKKYRGIKCGSTRQRQTNDSRYCQRHQAWCGGPFLVSGWHAVLYSGGGCDSTIAARCCMAWRKFRKLLPVLTYRQPHLRCMARCTRPLFTWLYSTISKRGAWTPWT